MDPDKALVRTAGEDVINLSVGEPFFLHHALRPLVLEAKPKLAMRLYPPHQGVPELIEVLQERHPGQHIVVANGAKQAILAALYAFRRRAMGLTGLYHPAPHWPTYPTLAALSNLHFVSDTKPDVLNHIYAVSSPNNPDGWAINSAAMVRESCCLWDAAYAHSVYGWDAAEPNHFVSVWSAAKLLGLSGYRVGWLATPDESLANDAADYVEKTTSGVNVAAQLKVAATLRWMQGNPKDTARAYAEARKTLLRNSFLFNDALGRFCERLEGVPGNGRGMFAWFKIKEQSHQKFQQALEKSKVAMVPGYACGMREPGWFRASLGADWSTLSKAMEKIRYYLGQP